MSLPGLSRSGGVRLATIIAASLLGVSAWAQSQPKFPTPLPVPKGAAPAAPEAAPTPAPPAAGAAPRPGGPRDPFEPLVRRPEPGQQPKVQEPKAPEVASLKLVGVIWDTKDSQAIRALVETPDGLGYYLRLNEEKFGGRVVALDRDRVRFVVREDVPGAGARERTVELRLPKPEGQ